MLILIPLSIDALCYEFFCSGNDAGKLFRARAKHSQNWPQEAHFDNLDGVVQICFQGIQIVIIWAARGQIWTKWLPGGPF